MGVGGAFGDDQTLGHLAVGESLRDKRGDLALPPAEPRQRFFTLALGRVVAAQREGNCLIGGQCLTDGSHTGEAVLAECFARHAFGAAVAAGFGIERG